MKPTQHQAVSKKAAEGSFRVFFDAHTDVLTDTVARLTASPVSSLMTVFVISIALLLPAMLQVVGNNLSLVDGQFSDSAQITLYLNDDLTEQKGLEVSDYLLMNPGVKQVKYISKAQALAEFSSNSGFSGIISELNTNPLPASIVVIPSDSSVPATRALYNDLQGLPEVELAQIDLEWIQRLEALKGLIERTGLIFSIILGVAVLFIIGNTIRLAIENRKSEIQVIKLVGGTDSFIARPFLYTGLLLGLAGGLVASVLITAVQLGFSSSLDNLLSLYEFSFPFQSFGIADSLMLIALGGSLGWIGALLSTVQHLLGKED